MNPVFRRRNIFAVRRRKPVGVDAGRDQGSSQLVGARRFPDWTRRPENSRLGSPAEQERHSVLEFGGKLLEKFRKFEFGAKKFDVHRWTLDDQRVSISNVELGTELGLPIDPPLPYFFHRGCRPGTNVIKLFTSVIYKCS